MERSGQARSSRSFASRKLSRHFSMRDDDVGFNTTMIVLNDALHAIENDKDFGKKVAQAIRDLNLRPDDGRGIDISSGNNANAATVVEQHHADYSVLCAVGGNCVT